jgi:oxygen-independent coproporphyrinogen-3 oxidase
VKEVVEQARETGYTSINFDLIYGLPLQKKSSIIDTISKVNLLKPDRIAFYSYAHVPWIKPGQRKFTEEDLPTDEEKRTLYEMGRILLEEAGYHEIGMDHFALSSDSLYKAALSGSLHRNFMGYTHSFTQLLIGLGVSSISDTWYAYAQNVKKVEEYYQLLNQNELPVFRGHILNKEDLILRKHILNLMCHFETSWVNEAEQTPYLYDAIEKLREMESDGLITLSPFSIAVTQKGKIFLRNICMAFDARLWRKIPQTEIFSKVI